MLPAMGGGFVQGSLRLHSIDEKIILKNFYKNFCQSNYLHSRIKSKVSSPDYDAVGY